MQLFLAVSLLGFATFSWSFFSILGVLSHPNNPQHSQQPPNSFPFGLPSPNSDHIQLFLHYFHQVWWHPWVLPHKEEMLPTSPALNPFPEAAGPHVGVHKWNLLCISRGGVRWESRRSHRGCDTRLPDCRCCHRTGRHDGFFAPPDGEFYEKYMSIRGGKIKHHIFGASAGGWGVARTEQQEAN